MVNKKSQAALDFLINYWWAILILLVAVSLLYYFDLFRFSRELSPKGCILIPRLGCEEFKVTSDGVEFVVRNGMGVNLVNFQVTLESPSNSTCDGKKSRKTTLINGQAKKFTIACDTSGLNKFESKLAINYKPSGYTVDHVARGQIISNVESGTLTGDLTDPTVILNSPLPFENITNTEIMFSCTASDDVNLTTITLYGNWSGIWQYIKTNNAATNPNTSTFNLRSIP